MIVRRLLAKFIMRYIPLRTFVLVFGAFGLIFVAFSAINGRMNASSDAEPLAVEAGQIGGEVTEDTPIVSSLKEMKKNADGFAVAVDTISEEYEMGEQYAWKAVVLDGVAIPVRYNFYASKFVDDEAGNFVYVSPVGTLVEEASEVEAKYVDMYGKDQVMTGYYIDMDGEVNSSVRSSAADMKRYCALALIVLYIPTCIILIVLQYKNKKRNEVEKETVAAIG